MDTEDTEPRPYAAETELHIVIRRAFSYLSNPAMSDSESRSKAKLALGRFADPEFDARLARVMAEDKEVLDRLRRAV